MLSGKKIVLGVSGGIAAYKACDIVSRLKKLNADVHVIMTASAEKFVTPLTFQSLSLNQVAVDMFDTPNYWEIEHISLAKLADVIVIAPATANIIGKLANGIADDMLSTTIMATKAKVLIAPAMNTNMYENPVLQRNIKLLSELGYIMIPPTEGRLACGDVGKGKMAEPAVIEKSIIDLLNPGQDMAGRTVLVTAGPTREAIDPVRFISNNSTGKMGYAIARQAALRGAKVYLVSGPTILDTPIGVERYNVISAEEMYSKVMELFPKCDIVIKAAAVADYAPMTAYSQKVKKSGNQLELKLKKNPDILFELGKIKGDKILVGFAMETENLVENAAEKVKKKNLDFIAANDLNEAGAGFAAETNAVKLIDREGNIENIPLKMKDEIADIILDRIVNLKRT
ncbi:MAG TPA: bifunctional phosphopantothenoylcysteine decarboxylase/phosphopantothenate--cysteine ligase CoaBC [Bacillota bacterium]|nr:bifunctional phosphopantothenoylcysteine decarboxylase/phosphopantothenate--cysteine ligase CoaBC [Bacillota bacterium]HNU79247.1 bifunctional phosphopantothenoylcysteine decarboxylase/phosphopantothenate--cysteine ligase CoaBC [Bacillota bacterium]HPL98826.1 bifunctional phosphopantothenoylcysteine decarboxylase/phosphopantothenate--cysteine ligase CoaBC [Bacillota bacterium]HPW40046.1 bifunctional phosphopantothenoylcysteine decarboxylase/phosphopantothenate--cysteine ligase CoaBC [Bacillot